MLDLTCKACCFCKTLLLCDTPVLSNRQALITNLAGQDNKDVGLVSVDQLGSKQHAAMGQQYDLQKKTAAVVAAHDAFTEAFAGYAVQMDDYRMTGQPVAPQVRHLIRKEKKKRKRLHLSALFQRSPDHVCHKWSSSQRRNPQAISACCLACWLTVVQTTCT